MKLTWRDYLTDAERATLAKADAAKARWLNLNRERAGITNRAIHRARHAAFLAAKAAMLRESDDHFAKP